jgi:hypothetical protein
VLQVKKVAQDLYEASATPPEIDEAWSTPEPMSARRLLTQLIDRGCHSIDAADVLNEQDPEWIAKAKGPYR